MKIVSDLLSDLPPGAEAEAVRRLQIVLRGHETLVVALSGGADSAFLAWAATRELGADRVRCVTAVSASLASSELDDCRALAAEWGLSWSTVETDELADPDYAMNDADRCYHCKAALSDALGLGL